MGDSDSVNAVSLSLPPPWLSNPSAWFRSVEAQFRSRRIRKQEKMFWHVVAAFPESWITRKLDDINPKSCYDDLKQAMLEGTRISEKERFTALTTSLELGD